MPSTATPDERLAPTEMANYLRFFSTMNGGMFSATLVKENGQGYNLVLHAGGSTPKVRLALVSNPADKSCVVGSSWDVRDIIEKVLTKNGNFARSIAETVDRTLQGSLGCVRLRVVNSVVVEASFLEGEIWP